MPLRITKPYFADSAHGSVRAIGTLRRNPSGTITMGRRPPGNPDPSNMPEPERQGFRDALHAYSELPRFTVFVGGRFRQLASETWEEFSAAWYAENNSWIKP